MKLHFFFLYDIICSSIITKKKYGTELFEDLNMVQTILIHYIYIQGIITPLNNLNSFKPTQFNLYTTTRAHLFTTIHYPLF